MDNKTQYIIWNPEGKTPPRVRFGDPAPARAEAERLAGAHPGQAFYVCQLVSVAQTGPVTTRELVEEAAAEVPQDSRQYRLSMSDGLKPHAAVFSSVGAPTSLQICEAAEAAGIILPGCTPELFEHACVRGERAIWYGRICLERLQ